MNHLKPYKKFKKRKTTIRKSPDVYAWSPTYTTGSPAPATSIPITQIKID